MIKLQFYSTNGNQLILELNLAAEAKIGIGEIKRLPTHLRFQRSDWQLVHQLKSIIFRRVVIQVNKGVRMLNVALEEF